MDIYTTNIHLLKNLNNFNELVNNEYSNYKGRLYFEEINKFIEYDLPKTKDKTKITIM